MQQARFVTAQAEQTAEYREVCMIVDALIAKVTSSEVLGRINDANQPGRSSADVQNAFLSEAQELGFRDESRGLFAKSATTGLRPDYYRALETTGILLEVERGKTTINNMDLLDFWKCHICEHAHYLILMVPARLRQNPSMSPRHEFNTVRKRLSSFFDAGNTTNVRGLFILGY